MKEWEQSNSNMEPGTLLSTDLPLLLMAGVSGLKKRVMFSGPDSVSRFETRSGSSAAIQGEVGEAALDS